MSNSEGEKKRNSCSKHKVWGSRKWAKEEKARDRLSTQLCGSGDRSASLCHISLRRSSQRLAGCIWPGLTLGGGVWVPGPEPSGPQPPSPLPHTSLASHWGQVREPLGRGASTSRTAPFKPLGGGGADPNRLQLSEKRAEDRGGEVERGEERGTGKERRWMTRGCRCELSWETNVQRLRGVKLLSGSWIFYFENSKDQKTFFWLYTRNRTVSPDTSAYKYSGAANNLLDENVFAS